MNIAGSIKSVVYNKASYYILDVFSGEYKTVTVKGNFFGLDRLVPGVKLCFKGKWFRSPKYGKQFHIHSWDVPENFGKVEAIRFLEYVVGFNYMSATFLFREYEQDIFKALDDTARIQKECSDLGEEVADVLAKWGRMRAIQALTEVLKDGGLSATEIESAVIRFGMDAPSIIKKNPFRLMEIPGFSFERVDTLALKLGFDPSNPQRLEGATLWALNAASREGHLFLKRGAIPTLALDLKNTMGPLPMTDASDRGFKGALSTLQKRGAIKVDPEAGAYTPESFKYERESAEILSKLMTPSSLQVELDPFLEEFERSSQMQLSDAQQDAVRQLIEHKVLVLTGLPGTGKTTAVKALVRLFEVSGTSFSLMAPTGIASKRLSYVTGHEAYTIHRALGYDGLNWQHGPSNKYVVDAVIVDEVSMVDQELFYRLLSSLRTDTMLVLVGDDAQLPSVGAGNVLKELVACDAVPSVRLTQIFRQAKGGDIVLNSHRINKGESPVLGAPKSDSEFRFVPISDEEKARQYIVKMATKLKERDANFQVLSPKYEGATGVNSLNTSLRDALNPPGPPEWHGKTQHFRLGDRIMVIKNNYKKGVWNGDVGKLVYISEGHITLRIYGVGDQTDQEVTFTRAEADETLRLAYAITVHKSQGSEFDTILLPVFNTHGRMLQRNLLYTAVTRAKKRVWLLGESSAIQRAIENNKVRSRNTALAKSITGVLERADGSS